MDFWSAVVTIVAIAISVEFLKFALKQKHKKAELDAKSTSSDKLEELEHRIESLETIIIDLEKENRYRDLR